MKRFYAFIILTMLVCTSFAQPPVKLLYLAASDPATDGDTLMPVYLTNMGFDITLEAISESSPTTGYDVVFLSETIGSGNVNWARYSTAPIPIVTCKTQASKPSALNWDGPGATQNYDSSSDTVIKVKAPSHPILTGFTENEIKLVENSTEGANMMWFNLGNIPGMTIVALAGTEAQDTLPSIVALEAGTAMNATVTLENRAVILGIQQACWRFLNDEGKRIFKNACMWAAGPQVGIDNHMKIQTSLFPNPSKGIVHLKFSQSIDGFVVYVVSLDGRIVYSKQITHSQDAEIDLSVLNAGIYFVKTMGSNLYHTEKVILTK